MRRRVAAGLVAVLAVAGAVATGASPAAAGPAAPIAPADPIAPAAVIRSDPAIGLPAARPPHATTPGPPSAPEYWFDSWQVPSLWTADARGQGITIAEVDTGVNADLAELRGRVLPGKDFGAGGDGRVDREEDAFGHGTAMASIMVGRPGVLGITGLAPDAKILPIAVPLRGTTDSELPDRLPDAITWAADHHARIISMSLGGKHSPQYDSQPCSDAEQAAIYHALRKGAIVLASVGNTGPRRNAIEDPAVCLGVVSVGAVTETGSVADFSTRQPYVTLVAPGVDIPSLGRIAGQAYSGDGTSQATAIASAVAALVWSKYPRLSAQQVVARILATLDQRRSTPSPAYGYGLLDAHAAVTAHVPAGAVDPVFAAAAPFMTRASGLDAAAKRFARTVPRAAAPVDRTTGSFAVGQPPGTPAKAVTGIALAAGGALLLLVLLVAGVRGRRRRPPPPPPLAPPIPAPAAEPPAGAIRWTAPASGPGADPQPVAEAAGEEPRRRPRPGPGSGVEQGGEK